MHHHFLARPRVNVRVSVRVILTLLGLPTLSVASPTYMDLPLAASEHEAYRILQEQEWFTEESLDSEDGVPTFRTGFAEVERGHIENLSDEELATLWSARSYRPKTVSPGVLSWLEGEQFEDERVVLRLRRAQRELGDLPPAFLEAHRSLLGEKLSRTEARQRAVAALAERRRHALDVWSARVHPGISSWQPLDHAVPHVLVRAPRDVVRALLFESSIIGGAQLYSETIVHDEDGPRVEAGGATPIDGKALASVIQSQQFYSTGYKGDEYLVIYESGGDKIHVDHPGFLDHPSGPRRASNCVGSSATCSGWTADPTLTASYSAHSTAVASIAAGDCTEGQDGIYSGAQAERQSGVARDATVWGVSKFDSSIHALLSSKDVTSFNMSAGGGMLCDTYTSFAFDADSIYEIGIAFVKSAGNNNNNHGQPYAGEADCNVSSPAQASGAFVVGAYYLDAEIPDDDPNTPGREDIPTTEGRLYAGSGYGGAVEQGYPRTLVDIVAPSLHKNSFPHYQWPMVLIFPDMYGNDWNSDGAGSDTFCCTSGSAPVVTGAMALYREWADAVGGIASDPGILYVRFLLMGDRWDGLTSYISLGYSPRSGAGRLRMRQYNGTGLDGPYFTKAGSVCVGDGETVYVPINGGSAFSSDIDVLKAVSWYYRTEDGNDDPVFNDVDLALQRKAGLPWVTIMTDNGTDDKRRVHLTSPGANAYRLQLTGASVDGTDAVCGSDKQRVHYAILAEDSDRETAENLAEVRTE